MVIKSRTSLFPPYYYEQELERRIHQRYQVPTGRPVPENCIWKHANKDGLVIKQSVHLTKKQNYGSVKKDKLGHIKEYGGIEVLSWSRKRGLLKTILIYSCAFLSFWAVGFLRNCISDSMKTGELERIEREIQNEIEGRDYDEALRMVMTLEPPSTFPIEKQDYWKHKRDGFKDVIIPLKRERDASDPAYICAPASSDELDGRNHEYVERLFREAGFTNIESIEEFESHTERIGRGVHGKTIEERPSFFFHNKGAVDMIQFGLLTEFTIEDRCKADDKITIYYHGDGREPVGVPVKIGYSPKSEAAT